MMNGTLLTRRLRLSTDYLMIDLMTIHFDDKFSTESEYRYTNLLS